MQYIFSTTSRMVTIALGCALLLCALFFLLGFEIGARFVGPASSPALATPSSAHASPAGSAALSALGGALERPAAAPILPLTDTGTRDVVFVLVT